MSRRSEDCCDLWKLAVVISVGYEGTYDKQKLESVSTLSNYQ